MMIEGDLSNYHHHTETETEDDREVANLSSSHTLVVRVPKKIHQICHDVDSSLYFPAFQLVYLEVDDLPSNQPSISMHWWENRQETMIFTLKYGGGGPLKNRKPNHHLNYQRAMRSSPSPWLQVPWKCAASHLGRTSAGPQVVSMVVAQNHPSKEGFFTTNPPAIGIPPFLEALNEYSLGIPRLMWVQV